MSTEIRPIDILARLSRVINISYYLNGADKKALRDMLNAEREKAQKPKPAPRKKQSNSNVEGA